jgi:sensor histidine kinase YesM
MFLFHKKYRLRFVVGIIALGIGIRSVIYIPVGKDVIYLSLAGQQSAIPCYFAMSLIAFYLADKLFARRKYVLFFLSIACLIAGCVWVADYIKPFRFAGFSPEANYIMHHFGTAFILSIAFFLRYLKYRTSREVEFQEYKARQTEAELRLLKQQINPHFLFNTLNSIYLKCLENTSDAGEMVLQLSDMLRYQLNTDKLRESNLRHELEFLENYIFFEKRRLPAHVTVDYCVEVDQPDVPIAPNLLIPLIENTFKHGVLAGQACRIEICLRVTQGKLHLRTQNAVSTRKSGNSTGIGLHNLEQRLQFLYDGKHQLTRLQQEGNYIAELNIDL